MPLYIDFIKLVVVDSFEYLIEVSIQHREHYLSFRVAETAVVFNYLWSLWSEHKTEVKTALESTSLSVHSVHSGEEYLLHALLSDILCVVRVR